MMLASEAADHVVAMVLRSFRSLPSPNRPARSGACAKVVGQRVRIIIPVGLEKRVLGNVTDIASELNAAVSEGKGEPEPLQTTRALCHDNI